MLHFACVLIFSNQILENKQVVIPLLVRGSQIGRKKERFNIHVGGPFSDHNQAWRKCEVLLNRKQHIETILSKQSNQVRSEYRIRLNASVDCVQFLLRQGIAFHVMMNMKILAIKETFLSF